MTPAKVQIHKLSSILKAVGFLVAALLFAAPTLRAQSPEAKGAQTPQVVQGPDERYKVDIMVVVAHPDDEGAASPFIARELDEGKRVAVVYGTRGGNGSNQAGPEHAAALADVREIEARTACAALGVTNVWFLGGEDTASQNVLISLANWGHGERLEEMVRLIRLTRPEVILTFFPGVFIGENHGDHQASGVIAMEGFDLAGDPTVFPSQVAGAEHRLEPYLENLRPWQVKKIYYFDYGGQRNDAPKGSGPSYSVTGMSKSRHMPYWRVAIESFKSHETQAKSYIDTLSKESEEDLQKQATDPQGGWGSEQSFVFGKSAVGGSPTGDMFENVTSAPAPAVQHAAVPAPSTNELGVELGGAWSFYEEFKRAHGLENLPHINEPEIGVQAGGPLEIPIWVRNTTGEAKTIDLAVNAPSGWTTTAGAGPYKIAAGLLASLNVEIMTPAAPISETSKDISEVTVTATSNGKQIGVIKLQVMLRKRALPQ